MTSLFLLAAHPLVHVNASLNTLAAVLLALGLLFIKQGKVDAHKKTMLSAFAVSILFLACYLVYHLMGPLHTKFAHDGVIKVVYYAILISHILLAITVPPLAIVTILLGLRSQGQWLPASIRNSSDGELTEYTTAARTKHRRWAKITFPVWMYVSVTGVVVYLMLYHLFPAG